MAKIETKKTPNMQDIFLNYIIKNKLDCFIYTITGVKLIGKIVRHDKFTIELQRDPKYPTLCYKQNIATISPLDEVYLEDDIL